MGLEGEGDYALANEWLSHATELFQREHPQCRCISMEWSVWSGAGMGQKLGRVDLLANQGISPIPVDAGIQEFLRLIDTPNLPTSLVITSRFGLLPTVTMTNRPPAHYRFIHSIPVYYPEIELVADCHVSPDLDPYLDDHKLHETRLFPAVMALEAMTEAAIVLMQKDSDSSTPQFHDVQFRQAIVVPSGQDSDSLVIRIAALADDQGQISLAIRSSTTNFQINHIEARCTLQSQGAMSGLEHVDLRQLPKDPIRPFSADESLYAHVLFQSGRFQRISGYQMIEARRCIGQLSKDGQTTWFGEALPQRCLLGDPGARDAALHGIQACIPHKTVIPVSVDKIECGLIRTEKPQRMLAIEVADHGQELVYDMIIFDHEGRPIETWHKLTLQVMGTPANLRINSPFLLIPFFERMVADELPEADLTLSIAAVAEAVRTTSVDSHHRPDGKPDPQNDRHQSASYSGVWRLSANSAKPIGCDLQMVSAKSTTDWEALLGEEGIKLAKMISQGVQESLDVAATRVWTAREAMKKAGFSALAPLTVDPDSSGLWVVFKSGPSKVFSSCVEASDISPNLCMAVALLIGENK